MKLTCTPRKIFRNGPTFMYRCQPELRLRTFTHQAMRITEIPLLSKGRALTPASSALDFRTEIRQQLHGPNHKNDMTYKTKETTKAMIGLLNPYF